MSVALFDSEELCGLWHDLGGDRELQPHLRALAAANHAAWLLTHGSLGPTQPGQTSVHMPDVTKPIERTAGWRPPVRRWVKNLAYNCIANTGVDFAPRKALEAVTRAALEVEARDHAVAVRARDEKRAPKDLRPEEA